MIRRYGDCTGSIRTVLSSIDKITNLVLVLRAINLWKILDIMDTRRLGLSGIGVL